jgi:hypothetical protein
MVYTVFVGIKDSRKAKISKLLNPATSHIAKTKEIRLPVKNKHLESVEKGKFGPLTTH